MKLKKLYTLPQFITLLSEGNCEDRLKKIGLPNVFDVCELDETCFDLTRIYNNILKQSPKKEMIINELKKPNRRFFDLDSPAMNQGYYNRLEAWQEAEKKVILKGFEKVETAVFTTFTKGNIIISFRKDGKIILHIAESERYIIETLNNIAEETNGELELQNVEL